MEIMMRVGARVLLPAPAVRWKSAARTHVHVLNTLQIAATPNSTQYSLGGSERKKKDLEQARFYFVPVTHS